MAIRRKKTAKCDAVAMLIADHKEVAKLFAGYKRAKARNDRKAKSGLVVKICQALTLHATIEEEIFYPATAELKAEDEEAGEIVAEAEEEHKIVKTLLEDLDGLDAGDEKFDAKVKVLTENVRHHADEEEEDMFPFFDDLPKERQDEVSQQLRARKSELTEE